jgi:hypothetical protein
MSTDEHEGAAERWLDEALEHYGAAAPLFGLEARIVAGLHARAHRRQRRWLLAVAAVAAVVLALTLAPQRWRLRKGAGGVAARAVAPEMRPACPAMAVLQPPRQEIAPRAPRRTAAWCAQRKADGWSSRTTGARQDGVRREAPAFREPELLRIYLRQTPRSELAVMAARQQTAGEIPGLGSPPPKSEEAAPSNKEESALSSKEEAAPSNTQGTAPSSKEETAPSNNEE